MKTQRLLSLPARLGCLILGLAMSFTLLAEVPQLISYQGRLVIGNTNYDGTAQLKFALVEGAPVTITTTYWSNDGSSVGGSEPTAAVSVAVTKGLYSVLLGDTALPNMTPVTPDVFTHGDVRLRVWFSDGASAFKLLSPDQRIASVGYALMARGVSDGAVSAAQIAPGAIGNAQLAADAVQTANLADGAVANAKLANSSITVTAGNGLAGGGSVALGGSVVLDTTATPNNTNFAIVQRDGAGGFSAGTITAAGFAGVLRVPGSTLTGGNATIGGGLNNTASGLGATIAGGEGNAATDEHATVGGGTNNTASHITATVAGGEGNQASGPISTVGGGFQNRVQGPYGTIAGGRNNTVFGLGSVGAAIAGGSQNVVGADAAFIGAGNSNANDGPSATITGGEQNKIITSGQLSAIGGGSGNLAFAKNTAIGGGEANAAGGPYATIGGGWGNTNQFGTASTLGGGQGNSIEYMNAATIGGGMSNSIRGFSSGATIPGGVRNVALGATAFAAGYRAHANDPGTFVWADGTEADFTSSSSNQFLIRATGGVGINTANPTSALQVNGTVTATQFAGDGSGLTGVATTSLADGSVTAAKIASGGVGSVQLATNAVQTANLANGAVLNGKLANSSVTVTAGNGLSGGGSVALGAAVTLNTTATANNTPSTIVQRDANGDFAARNIDAGTLTLANNLALPNTTDAAHGVISFGGQPWIHAAGKSNVFMGIGAGNLAATGSWNVGVGKSTLTSLTTGNGNTAMGYNALRFGTNALWNTAVGALAAESLTTGEANTAVGEGALNRLSGGDHNTAIGVNALYFLGSGSNNIALGSNAGIDLTNGSYNIYVGFGLGAAGQETNTMRLGVPGTQHATYIAGIAGATVSGGVAVFAKPDGQLGTLTSSARFKQDIHDMGAASDVLLDLRPVAFRYKEEIDPGGRPQFGLVAEEVEKVAPDLVLHDAAGAAYTVRYEAVNAMVLNEFLKQHRTLKDHEQTISALKSANAALEARLTALESMLRQVAEHSVEAKIGDQTVAVNDRQLR